MKEEEQADEEEERDAILTLSVANGNLEKVGNLSSMNLKPGKRLDQDMSQPYLLPEESKLQSPRSSLNSTLIAAV